MSRYEDIVVDPRIGLESLIWDVSAFPSKFAESVSQKAKLSARGEDSAWNHELVCPNAAL